MKFSGKIIVVLVLLLVMGQVYAQRNWRKFPSKNSDTEKVEGVVADTMKDASKEVVEPITIVPGYTSIQVDSSITFLDDQLKEEDKNDPRIQGYTIIIWSGSGANSKNGARWKQKVFNESFPIYETHLTWKNPNYEVRVGDFRTKIEAEKVLNEINEEFPTALVRSARVELPDIEPLIELD